MEIQIAVSKMPKFTDGGNFDCFEAVERPQGGISLVLADGNGSPVGLRPVSHFVVRKVANYLTDGVRDSAAARAASDSLFTEQNGKVSCSLSIISVDTVSKTIVLCRNTANPFFFYDGQLVDRLAQGSQRIGASRNIKPVVTEFPIGDGLTIVECSDGVLNAGHEFGEKIDPGTIITGLMEDADPTPQALCDSILVTALRLARNRPTDDMTVVAIRVQHNIQGKTRRMSIQIPIQNETPDRV